jgi:hypothetical protein
MKRGGAVRLLIAYACCLVHLCAHAAGPVLETTFTAQLPVSPGLYDAPSSSTQVCSITVEMLNAIRRRYQHHRLAGGLPGR